MDMIIIFCANYLIVIMGLITLAFWLTRSRKIKTEMVVTGVVIAIASFIFAKTGSMLFNDPRPFVTDHITPLFTYPADNGFPSDHTLVGMMAALTVLSVSRRWGVILFALTLVVGGARVAAGVHHPIDIVGGIVFGALGGVVAVYVAPKIIQWLSSSSYAKSLGLHRVTANKR